MSSVRTLLLGCGRVADHYLDVLEGTLGAPIEGIEIVGACDVRRERAERMVDRLGGTAFEDLDMALAELRPDLVIVMTPSGSHHAHALTVLEAGSHVLVEKPLAMRPDEADEIVALAQARGLHCGVALQNRLNPAVRAVHAVRDELGPLVTASARLRWARFQDYYEDGWHGTWAMDGGVINQQALHHLDALQWVCGPIEAVCASETRRANDLEAEDTLVAVLRFTSGALGTIEATTAARPADLEASLTLTAAEGSVSIGGIALNLVTGWQVGGHDEATVMAQHSHEVRNGYGDSHVPLLQAMVDAVAGRRDAPAVTGDDGREVTALIHALYRSVEVGGWVRLDDRPVSTRLGRDPRDRGDDG
jgi:predicted dehydrogenase